MQAQSLLGLALAAMLLAALPLWIVWRSPEKNKLRRLGWITAFLTLDLIMFGAFTRLTDSGLGCPDWPGCYGHANPLSAGESIRAAESAMPTGPVTMTKAWIEMLHRYFAMAVGVLVIGLVFLAWRRWLSDRRRSPWLATGILAAICVQGAFGAWTVTLKLQPIVVTAHLLGGMTLLALLVWLAFREESYAALPQLEVSRLRPWAVAALVLLFIQIALGGWVSSNYAVMACPDFPLCHGRLVPELDFEHAFTLWRDLGKTSDGSLIPFSALVAIHWVHRSFAYVVTLVAAVLVWRSWRSLELKRAAKFLLAVLLLQLFTGMSNVVLKWPLVLAVLHNGGAAVLLAILVFFNLRLSRSSAVLAQMPQSKMPTTPILPRSSADAR